MPQACGIDTRQRSAGYIQLYQGDAEVLQESLEFIQRIAASTIAAIRRLSSTGE